MHRIDGPGATVDNKFTDGDPVGGVQATVVTDDFLNDVQEELISVLAAAGLTPVKGTQDQVLQAIYKLAQSQKATAFTAAGTATALTLTPTPAISAYAANQRFTVKFPVSSGLNPTLNVSAKGAKSLKQYDSAGAKVAAQFVADQVGDVLYDGVDFVVLDPLPLGQNHVGIQGSNKNLKVSTTGTTALITVTADELIIKGGNSYQTLSGLALSLSALVSGVNGLDSGSVSGGTWYYLWAIWNPSLPSAPAGLLSLSSTSPSMPSGYTHRARIGSIRTDSASPFNPLAIVQFGKRVQYKPTNATNTLRFPNMSSGSSIGNPSIPAGAVAVSTAQYVPETASSIKVYLTQTASAGLNGIVVPSNNYGIDGSPTQPPIGLTVSNEQGTQPPIEFMLESANVFLAAATAYTLSCIGWEDTI